MNTKSSDVYTGIATKWDKYTIDWYSKQQGSPFVKFIESNVQDHIGKPINETSVLDCAAGAGAQAIPIRQIGFKVTISDGNPDMIKEAIKNAKQVDIEFQKTIKTSLLWENIKSYFKEQSKTFDIIYNVGNSFPHELEPEKREQAIRGIYDSLNDNGVLVIDHRDYEHMEHLKKSAEELTNRIFNGTMRIDELTFLDDEQKEILKNQLINNKKNFIKKIGDFILKIVFKSYKPLENPYYKDDFFDATLVKYTDNLVKFEHVQVSKNTNYNKKETENSFFLSYAPIKVKQMKNLLIDQDFKLVKVYNNTINPKEINPDKIRFTNNFQTQSNKNIIENIVNTPNAAGFITYVAVKNTNNI